MSAQTTLHWYFDEEARAREEMLLARLEGRGLRWITRGQRWLGRGDGITGAGGAGRLGAYLRWRYELE